MLLWDIKQIYAEFKKQNKTVGTKTKTKALNFTKLHVSVG